jgi:hypothetical protein
VFGLLGIAAMIFEFTGNPHKKPPPSPPGLGRLPIEEQARLSMAIAVDSPDMLFSEAEALEAAGYVDAATLLRKAGAQRMQ